MMKFTRIAMICSLGIACGTGGIAFAQSVRSPALDEILRVTMAEMRLNETAAPRIEVAGLNPNIFGKLTPPSRPSSDAVVGSPSASATKAAHKVTEKKAELKAGQGTKDR